MSSNGEISIGLALLAIQSRKRTRRAAPGLPMTE